MLNFEFYSPTRLVFGKGTVDRVGDHIAPLAKKVLLHYGSDRVVNSGLLKRIEDSLTRAGISYVPLGGVIANPDIELALKGVALARKEKVDLILCVGGGSVIDSGKAIALGLKNPDLDLWKIYENNLETSGAYPVACVLTFPAAGSEASNSTVISNYKANKKCGYNREWNRPVLSIIDPTLFETIPKFQIASGVADMMSHIFERYFSNTEHTELSDALSEATLRTLLTFGPKVVEDPTDYDSWCQVALCGTIAHNNMLGVGREQDWACHKLDHELTARFGVTHGAGLAVLTPAWIRYVWRVNPKRFYGFAVRIMGEEPEPKAVAATIESGVSALETFYSRLGLPSRLTKLGVEASAIPEMARQVTHAPDGSERPLGGIKKLYEADAKAIYEKAI
ncbi:MAG: iron-containing alcohol dehydrogenase [Eubacteriales bacterium]|nr:iron-containing alcohol dehydrogenase [Eubacteriales bacterium]